MIDILFKTKLIFLIPVLVIVTGILYRSVSQNAVLLKRIDKYSPFPPALVKRYFYIGGLLHIAMGILVLIVLAMFETRHVFKF